ncbi:hypothetical protein Nepgr_010925 [Nepenthes gracilis]|uniref:non-specific serine/threonine protein kinase n=1 Tax=Nepenthes gracilis TaxID=150966 RepID=A0AAD3SE63_NEPGR|nr:hypothetical protein Nepgr_010925 [Nepenthes gracilis]
MTAMVFPPSSSVSLSKFLCYYLIFLVVIADDGSVLRAPITSVTKQIYFPEFSRSLPSINHGVKLLGSAKIASEKGIIQIPDPSKTEDMRHQAGRAIYAYPIRVFDPHTRTPASFQTTFSFRLSNHTLPSFYDENPEEAYGGSGLTFIVAPDEFTVGRPGPWLGMLNDACSNDYQKFVAVEFDTRQNTEFGDPNDNHIGINLGSIVSRATINASDLGITFKDGSIHQASISYDGRRKWMDIWIGSSKQNFVQKSAFSGELDISPFLREYMFVGFSASTGNKTQIHNVLSWNFTSTSPAFLRLPAAETCESKLLINNFPSEEEKPSTTFVVFVSVSALSLAALICLYFNGKRRKSATVLHDLKPRPRPPNRPRRFTATEIWSATRGFNEHEVLTSDSSGLLCRGTFPNGCQVAVKRFTRQFLSSVNLDRRRFVKRVRLLCRFKHKNLLPVRGWCYDNREFMVVYEYLFNGCLDKWLFGVGVLPWTRRFKVIKTVAIGLSYMHSHQLFHNNVRVSSVFLDVSFKAALGDFGLGDLVGVDLARTQCRDVFDFGVFVLEVVSGRRRFESNMGSGSSSCRRSESIDLLDFSWQMHERGQTMEVVDRRMGSGIDPDQVVRAIQIGLICTLNERNGRPSMEKVVRYMDMDTPLPELSASRPKLLIH